MSRVKGKCLELEGVRGRLEAEVARLKGENVAIERQN